MSARARALHAFKVVAAAVDRVRPPGRGVTVLLYHRVGGASGTEVDLPVALFEAQIAELADSGRVIPLDSALGVLAGDPPAPPDPVVVTFDDGTADFVDAAVPVLARHRVPATLYLATDFVECGRRFPDDGPPLSWAGLADALTTGVVTVGSHTHTHALLDRTEPGAAADELDRSLGLISDRLGVPAQHFAYPKALVGPPAVEAEVRHRFASAALAGGRGNRYGSTDPYRLARTPIQRTDGMAFFRRKAAGGMSLEGSVRNAAARRRYARASS